MKKNKSEIDNNVRFLWLWKLWRKDLSKERKWKKRKSPEMPW